ncbi:Dabb family protein [Microbacterium sp. MEC084]|jgi:antibiotic biosynthesis monooxygenase (ABM) superfamily enzyme|uniref:Dabb family protein n=1 Tax=unclassified Microbacterium TaxID=2609290 RepID=UPI0006F9C25F|nr:MULTISPECIES: Dabb family protein [unclassified Microbacterium]KQY96913.1 stress responsive alpha-beta barrel domain-containing protein [Microbacterium sp. Root53]MCD1268089.1 Dabb family protein [Microbacterium sp. MEC084]
MLRHIVMFQLTATDPAEKDAQVAEAKAQLEALVGVVPGLRAMDVSRNVAFEGQNMDFALVADFDDLAALEAYGTHPAHVKAAEYIGTIRSGRAAIDVEI